MKDDGWQLEPGWGEVVGFWFYFTSKGLVARLDTGKKRNRRVMAPRFGA